MIHIGKGVSKLGANQDRKEREKNQPGAGDIQETNGYKSHIYTFIQETITPTIQDTTSLSVLFVHKALASAGQCTLPRAPAGAVDPWLCLIWRTVPQRAQRTPDTWARPRDVL